jgi:hypothetical protein
MPGFFRVLVCAITIGSCLLAGKADALPAGSLAGTNIDGAFCGIGHKGVETDGKPAPTGEVENAIPVGPELALSTAQGWMKCHQPGYQALASAINHPCHQMKCCDPASPGAGAPGGFLSWDFTTETAGADNRHPGSVAFASSHLPTLLRPESPEPRPPASLTV